MQPGQLSHWKFSPFKGVLWLQRKEQNPEQPWSLAVYQGYGKGRPIVCYHRLEGGGWRLFYGARTLLSSSSLLKTFGPDGTMTQTAHHDPASHSASPSKDMECNDLFSLLPLEGFVLTFFNDSMGCQLLPFSPLPVVTRLIVTGHSLEAQAAVCLAEWELTWVTLAPALCGTQVILASKRWETPLKEKCGAQTVT